MAPTDSTLSPLAEGCQLYGLVDGRTGTCCEFSFYCTLYGKELTVIVGELSECSEAGAGACSLSQTVSRASV